MLPSWDPGATLPTWKSGRSYIGFPNVYSTLTTLHRRNRTRVPLSILNRDGVGKVASPSPRKPNPLLILARIALYGASVFLVFTVTLGCFPAITMLVQSTGVMQCSAPSVRQTDLYIISSLILLLQDPESSWSTDYFVPVVCFVLFNVGDWIGRILAERLTWPKPGKGS